MNKYEQYVRYILDNSKVRNILLELTCRVEIFEQGGKGIPQGDTTEKEEVEDSRRSGEGQIQV